MGAVGMLREVFLEGPSESCADVDILAKGASFSENLCTFMLSLDGMACLLQHPGRPILQCDVILGNLLLPPAQAGDF